MSLAPRAPRSAVPISAIAMPAGVRAREERGDLVVELTWEHWIYQVSCLVPILFAIVVWVFVLRGGPEASGYTPALLFGLVPFLGGLWGLLAFSLNKTTLRVGLKHLQIEHGPVPAALGRTVPVGELVQLYCRREVHRSQRRRSGSIRIGPIGDDGNTGDWTDYSLWFLDRSGRRSRLVAGIASAQDALALENLIEMRLGIVDQPGMGNVPKPG